jgi:ATP-dependent Lon protease
MTGEITLHGKVLPIGGLKEKVLAAQREGMEHIIIPEKNRATYMALPASVKKRLTVSFVKDFKEVFETMFDVTVAAPRELQAVKIEVEKIAS